MKIVLEKEDCYCGLQTFCENVARKMNSPVPDDSSVIFNCSEICVTKAVKDEIWNYYYTEKGVSNLQLAAVWVCIGPKANLEHEKEQYVAKVNGGFINWE